MGYDIESRFFIGWKVDYSRLVDFLVERKRVPHDTIEYGGLADFLDETERNMSSVRGWRFGYVKPERDADYEFHFYLVLGKKGAEQETSTLTQIQDALNKSNLKNAKKLAKKLGCIGEEPTFYSTPDLQ